MAPSAKRPHEVDQVENYQHKRRLQEPNEEQAIDDPISVFEKHPGRKSNSQIVGRLGGKIPQVRLPALLADGTLGEIALDSYRGRYLILLFYPADFTFVCPTELLAFRYVVHIHFMTILLYPIPFRNGNFFSWFVVWQ